MPAPPLLPENDTATLLCLNPRAAGGVAQPPRRRTPHLQHTPALPPLCPRVTQPRDAAPAWMGMPIPTRTRGEDEDAWSETARCGAFLGRQSGFASQGLCSCAKHRETKWTATMGLPEEGAVGVVGPEPPVKAAPPLAQPQLSTTRRLFARLARRLSLCQVRLLRVCLLVTAQHSAERVADAPLGNSATWSGLSSWRAWPRPPSWRLSSPQTRPPCCP